jgi:phosphoglycerate dehydrogenase-like enzyme
VPVWLIKRQPDLGTALMIGASGFYVLFLAGLSWKIIVGLVAVAGAATWRPPPAPAAGHRLFKHSRAVFSPHLGGQTVDAQRRVATDVAESIGLALSRGEIRDAVNVVQG